MKWRYRFLTVLVAVPVLAILAVMLIVSWPFYIMGFFSAMISGALRRWGFKLINKWSRLASKGWPKYGGR